MRTFILFCLALPIVSFAADESFRVIVHSGHLLRTETVVVFPLPDEATNWRLRDPSGRAVPCQIGPGREARFILPRLEAGQTAIYRLERGQAGAWRDRIGVERRAGVLRVALDGRPVLDFHVDRSRPPAGLHEAYGRSGYIHPLFSPSGLAVTGDFAPDNPQQHGIWFAWPNTEVDGHPVNFWDAIPTNNPAQHRGAGSGRIELVELSDHWSGPVHGGFRAEIRYVDQSVNPEKPAVLETWTVRAYGAGQGADRHYIIDLESEQRCAGDSPVRFPEHRYGGFCIRGRSEWLGPDEAVSFLTSAGETNRIKAHGSRARWCYMGGSVAEQFTGLAVLAHPENFRFPEPLRVHPELPFLNFAPSQAGLWELGPTQPMVWKYRLLVRDGRPELERCERFWSDYAYPVRVVVEPRRQRG